MARAKKMIRKSEREALKERRRSGEFKQDKKDARAAGLSRGEARRKAKRLSRVQALANRKAMRADMDAKRNEDASVNKMFADRKRMEAKRGGQKLAYDVKPAASPAKQREMAPGGTPTKKLIGSEKVTFDKAKGMFKIVSADGYVRYSKSKPAMYGAKVKPVKKAPGGAAMKKMPTYEKGGALKSVPSDNKGLPKLATSVRNNMGYMEDGGKLNKRTTTVTENTPSRYSKFTDAQKAQIKAKGERLKGEDKKDFDYDVARSKDTKSKNTTTTKRRSGKVKSVSVTEKRKSLNPGKSTDVTTTSKKRRGGSTRVKTTSYGAGDDRDAGRVVKQKFNRKGALKKTKVLKAAYGASMKKKAMYGAKMKK